MRWSRWGLMLLASSCLLLVLSLAAPPGESQAQAGCLGAEPSFPRPELAPFVGRWGGHFVDMFVVGDGTAVILWRAGHRIGDGGFITGAGLNDETGLMITSASGRGATGCVVSSSSGAEEVGLPALLTIGNDGLLTVQFGGGTVLLERVRIAPPSAQASLGDPSDVWVAVLHGDLGSESEAAVKARAASNDFPDAGILLSTNYPNLRPGFWVVYIGPYSDEGSAAAAAQRARDLGYSGAYPRFLGR